MCLVWKNYSKNKKNRNSLRYVKDQVNPKDIKEVY